MPQIDCEIQRNNSNKKSWKKERRNIVLSAQSCKTTFVFTFPTFVESAMLLYVLENVERNNTQKKFYDLLQNFICLILSQQCFYISILNILGIC